MKLVEAVDYVVRTPDGNALQSGITFDVKSGDRLGITGPSGCGKSTLLRQIAAEAAQPNGSEASLKVAVAAADFLPQGEFLFPWFTPKQNYNAWLGRKVGSAIEGLDLGRAQILEIEALLDRRFSDLSGGERQRVALWTALSREIDLLIVDEPFTALGMLRSFGHRLKQQAEGTNICFSRL
jgi:ABC-type nitrate/sulfonate/bicarbonate transport system ATPase subunit